MVPRLQLRHCLAAEWVITNPVLKLGEVGVETDTGQAKVGDGSTPWNGLPYIGNASGVEDAFEDLQLDSGTPGGDVFYDGGVPSSTYLTLHPIDGGLASD